MSSTKGHYFRPLAAAVLARSTPDMSGTEDARQRENDRKFIIALAEAFRRGDHLPRPKPEPVRTRPVPVKRHPLFAVWDEADG